MTDSAMSPRRWSVKLTDPRDRYGAIVVDAFNHPVTGYIRVEDARAIVTAVNNHKVISLR